MVTTKPGPVSPKTIEEYVQWARDKLGVDYESEDVQNKYNMTVAAASSTVDGSAFWASLSKRLEDRAATYRADTGAGLFMLEKEVSPKLLKKSYESAVNKSFRLNVLWNNRFPSQPQSGFVTPDNWFSEIDDLLRSTIVCKYIDGPESVVEALSAAASGVGLESEARVLALSAGYYAHHFYVKIPVMVIGATVETRPISVEIQVTTQMQDLLRQLTHRVYETERLLDRRASPSWRWDFRTSKFTARYLGHTLHLLESVIVQVRDEHLGKGVATND